VCAFLMRPTYSSLCGHVKKRHLHAHSPVNFKELKCYLRYNWAKLGDGMEIRGDVLKGLLPMHRHPLRRDY
jgi:hypothetical protein